MKNNYVVRNAYYEKLKDKTYKIYPFFVEENEGLPTYINSLIYELQGFDYYLNDTQSSMLQTIISIFEHFYDDSLSPSPDYQVIRREWLNCLNLMDKIHQFRSSDTDERI